MSGGALRSLPVEPLPGVPAWSRRLAAIAAQPLEFCPQLPQIARRFEAWWRRGETDRPLFIAATNPDPSRPINRRLDLLDQPDAWFDAKQRDLRQQHWVGDAIPTLRIDLGAASLGAIVGAPVEFSSDTTWTHAFIDDDWTNAPRWELREDSHWWRRLRELAERVARDAAGRYCVGLPDLGGAADAVLNMRGAEQLCLDALDQPQRIKAALDAAYPVWRKVMAEVLHLTIDQGAAPLHWLMLWSSQPYIVPTCDFNYMLGPEEFQAICLPDIQRLAATTGRAAFHLDGPQAARHIDALLEVPELTAIQFTPGAGAPSALPWVPMFRKVQDAGKALVVIHLLDEVLEVAGQLDKRGLAFLVDDPRPGATEQTFDALCRRY